MEGEIILNNYISGTNPLYLGYIEIWGLGSVSITSVTVSTTNNVNYTVPHDYNTETKVCDYWKTLWYFPPTPTKCFVLPLSYPLLAATVFTAVCVQCEDKATSIVYHLS